MNRPAWRKPYTGSLVLAAILLVLTAALVADTVKLTIGTNPIGMLTGYVAGAVLSALALAGSLIRAHRVWHPTRRWKVLYKPTALVLLVLYLLLAVASGWMMLFGNATGVPSDTQNGTLVLILATEMMVPVIIISGLRKE